MALNQMQKANLEKLKLENEGVSAAGRKKEVATDEAVLFISLGGLAGEALNILKGKAVKAFGGRESLKKIRFLAVDSDQISLSLIQRRQDGEGGNLDDGEIFSVYDASMCNILRQGYEGAPEDTQEWLSQTCTGIVINENGAQA